MAKGYTRLVLQIGKGDEECVPQSKAGITVDHYSLKPSIKTDMQQASLIISHGGMAVLHHNTSKIVVGYCLAMGGASYYLIYSYSRTSYNGRSE